MFQSSQKSSPYGTLFSISVEIQDGSQKSEKSNFFRGATGVALGALGVQNLRKIILSQHFPFTPKFKIFQRSLRSKP